MCRIKPTKLKSKYFKKEIPGYETDAGYFLISHDNLLVLSRGCGVEIKGITPVVTPGQGKDATVTAEAVVVLRHNKGEHPVEIYGSSPKCRDTASAVSKAFDAAIIRLAEFEQGPVKSDRMAGVRLPQAEKKDDFEIAFGPYSGHMYSEIKGTSRLQDFLNWIAHDSSLKYEDPEKKKQLAFFRRLIREQKEKEAKEVKQAKEEEKKNTSHQEG